MKSSLKKIISAVLIILLILPTLITFAETQIIYHEYTLEEYLKEKYNVDELTDDFLASIESLSIYNDIYMYNSNNLVNFNLDLLPKLTNLKRLTIDHDALKSFDMSLISNLSNLESIRLTADSLQEIKNWNSETFSNLKNFRRLYISSDNENFKDLKVNKIEFLEELTININSLENLELTNELINLKDLAIYCSNNLTEFEISKEFINLEELHMDINNIESLEIPKELTNLKRLSINGYDLQNITIMPDNLENINIWAANLANIEFPEKLDKLTDFSLYSWEITELEITEKFKNLEGLDIWCYNLEKLTLSDKLTKLLSLEITSDELEELKISKEAIELNYLNIDCSNLQSLSIPTELTKLSNINIHSYELQNLIIPEELIELEYLDVYANNLTEFKISEKWTELKYIDIISNKLNKLEIPNTLTKLNSVGISDVTSKNLIIPTELVNLTQIGISASGENLELPDYLTKIENLMLSINGYYLKELEISEKFNNIEYLYVYAENITEMTISANLRYLYIYVNDLEKLNLSSELTNLVGIGVSSNNLKELTIPNQITNLNNLVIYSNVLEEIDLPNTLENLEYLTIDCNNLKEVIIPNEISKISSLSIYGEKIEKITLPENLSDLYNLSIKGKNLTELNLPNNWENIQEIMIEESSLDEFNISNELSNLRVLKFNSSTIKELAIPDLTKLSDLVIECDKLEKLTLEEKNDNNSMLSSIEISCGNLNQDILNEIYLIRNLYDLDIYSPNTVIDLNGIEKLDLLNSLFITAKGFKDDSIEPISKINNLSGLSIETKNEIDLSSINEHKRLQHLYVTELEDSGEIIPPGEISRFSYKQEPVYNYNDYLFGFNINLEDGDTKETFLEEFDYSNYVAENNLENPSIKLFNNKGEELEDDKSFVGTGTKIVIYDGETEVAEFKILYYGDVNGDGKANAIDALAIVQNNFTEETKNSEGFKFSDDLYEEAGRILTKGDNTPGAVDALAIVQQAFGTYKINQYKRIDEIEPVG